MESKPVNDAATPIADLLVMPWARASTAPRYAVIEAIRVREAGSALPLPI